MKRSIILALTLILALALFLNFNTPNTNYYGYTKAFCDGQICEDYEIHCKDNKLQKLTPTGFAIRSNIEAQEINENILC